MSRERSLLIRQSMVDTLRLVASLSRGRASRPESGGKPQLQFQLQFTGVQHCPRRYTPHSDLHRWTLVDVRKRRAAAF